MAEPRFRKFNLGDALIAVAALGIVLALYRDQPYPRLLFQPRGVSRAEIGPFVEATVGVLTPGLATATLAVLAMRWRQPRPDRRRLTRQPGASACLAAALVMAVDLTVILVSMFAGPIVGIHDPRADFLTLITGQKLSYVFPFGGAPGHPDVRQVGLAIAATWFVQALGHRWRPASDWLDRLGRALGVGWIVLMVLAWFTM